MKSNLFLRVIIVLFCGLWVSIANAESISDQEARQWVKEKGEKLISTFGEPDISKKYEILDDMLIRYIDLKYVSKFVMGKYWRQMDPKQQEEYQVIFERYVKSIYKSFPLDFDTTKISFDIISIRTENQKTTVRTKINLLSTEPNAQPLSDIFVDFILIKQNNEIKIIDLKLGESSLILSYRSRFYEMIAANDDDITWFLEDLSDITEAAERTNQEKLLRAEY